MSQPDPSRIPVLVGVGQSIERDKLVNIVDLTESAAHAAFDDAPGLRDKIERLTTVSVIFSPCPKAPSKALAARLELTDVDCESTTVGGNTPQWLMNRAADEIAAGKLNATLIVGAECTRSVRAADPKADLFASLGGGKAGKNQEREPVVGPSLDGILNMPELAAGLTKPADVYPIYESVLAAKAGRNMQEQRKHCGHLLEPFAKVAASNPFSWFKEEYSASDISTPTDFNRIIAEPYTKRMNSFPNVNQGAALIVTSLAVARSVGLEDQCIFPWSGATNTDIASSAREDLGVSPAAIAASSALFAASKVGLDDFDYFDIYACFPSAIEILIESIDLAWDDPRGLTQTGGLSFFGGPGNNYVSHSIIATALRLRESGRLAYVAGMGGFLTKHSVGIYGSQPPPSGFRLVDTQKQQAEIEAAALPVTSEASGQATVVAGAVIYERDGSVCKAPVIANLADGQRVVASADPAILSELAGGSLVGRTITVSGAPLIYQ